MQCTIDFQDRMAGCFHIMQCNGFVPTSKLVKAFARNDKTSKTRSKKMKLLVLPEVLLGLVAVGVFCQRLGGLGNLVVVL